MYRLLQYRNSKNYDGSLWSTETVENDITEDTLKTSLDIYNWEALKEPNHRHDKPDELVTDSYYIRRDDDSTILNHYVNSNYDVFQYKEAWGVIRPFVEEGLVSVDSVLYLGHGKSLTFNLNTEDFTGEVYDGDIVRRFLNFTLSHTKEPRGFFFTDIRSVCANTLAFGRQQAIKEARDYIFEEGNIRASIKKAKELIDLTKHTFHKVVIPTYRKWNELKLDESQVDTMLRRMLNLPLATTTPVEELDVSNTTKSLYGNFLDAIDNSPGNQLLDLTGYKFFNGITYTVKNFGKEDLTRYRNNLVKGQKYRTMAKDMLTELVAI